MREPILTVHDGIVKNSGNSAMSGIGNFAGHTLQEWENLLNQMRVSSRTTMKARASQRPRQPFKGSALRLAEAKRDLRRFVQAAEKLPRHLTPPWAR